MHPTSFLSSSIFTPKISSIEISNPKTSSLEPTDILNWLISDLPRLLKTEPSLYVEHPNILLPKFFKIKVMENQ